MHDRSVFSARISVCISSVAREAAAFAPPVALSGLSPAAHVGCRCELEGLHVHVGSEIANVAVPVGVAGDVARGVLGDVAGKPAHVLGDEDAAPSSGSEDT